MNKIYFFITDISGYTAFMIKNEMARTHATIIITELMESLIKAVRLPFEISKLEGDAIFLFLREEKIPKEFQEDPLLLTSHILSFFQIFKNKLQSLQYSMVCNCGGCANIEKLTLKIIAHYGEASSQNISSFQELSGVDVILAHRLLKNQLKEHCYFLMTEQVYKKLLLPPESKIIRLEEHDKDFGIIPIYVYYPSKKEGISQKSSPSFIDKTRAHLKLIFGTLFLKLGIKKHAPFHNLP